jgi:hypothetical protein
MREEGEMTEQTHVSIYDNLLNVIIPLLQSEVRIARYALAERLATHRSPLVQRGQKVFSQNDEDGITFAILERLSLPKGIFCELGVGNGLENNTLALAAAGWRGAWIGGEDLAFDVNIAADAQPNFAYRKAWITRDNVVTLFLAALADIGESHADLISLDLDGNDLYLTEALLDAGVQPQIFILEYNAKFPPPIQFVIDYDPQHRWHFDDYYGASLAAFNDLLRRYNYFLACCNATGVNAFFVHERHRQLFSDVPNDIGKLYEPPRHFLTGLDFSGHPVSRRTVEKILRSLSKPVNR